MVVAVAVVAAATTAVAVVVVAVVAVATTAVAVVVAAAVAAAAIAGNFSTSSQKDPRVLHGGPRVLSFRGPCPRAILRPGDRCC